MGGFNLFHRSGSIFIASALLCAAGATASAQSVPWWDTGYSNYRQVTPSAGAVAIPAGNLASLSFDHAALVAGGQSLVGGNDLRLVFWNGVAYVELSRALASGSSWNNAATRITFKTQALIAAAGSDPNYYLYFGNPAAAAPPAAVPSARFFKAEQLAGQSTTSTTFVDVPGTTLTFTPGDASETWVIFATGVMRSNDAGQVAAEMRLLLNGAVADYWGHQTSNASTPTGAGFFIFDRLTGVTGTQTVQLQFLTAVAGATSFASQMRVVALLVPPGADFQYAETDATLAASGTNLALQALAFTPPSPGDYCVFSKASQTRAPGAGSAQMWLEDAAGGLHPDAPAGVRFSNARNPWQPGATAFRQTLAAAAQTFTLRGTSSGGGAASSSWRYRKVMAFRADAWEAQEYSESLGLSTTASAAFVQKNALVTAAPPAARDYVVVQLARLSGDSSNANPKSGELRDGGAPLLRTDHHINRDGGSNTGYHHMAGVANVKNSSASVTYENGFLSPGGITVECAESTILALRYHEPGTALGSIVARVFFALASLSGLENVAAPAIAVTLSGASDATITVDYAVTAGGTAFTPLDYVLTGTQLSFAPGVTSMNLPLTIVDNLFSGPDKTILFQLSSPAGAHLGTPTLHTYTILDDDLPHVVRVTSSTSDGFYSAGATIDVTVEFSDMVTLAGGELLVALNAGATVSISPFVGMSAAGTYTVVAGQNSLDLNALSPLTLSGGTLQDGPGDNVNLTIPGGEDIADLKAIVIDTLAPGVSMSSGAADPTNGSPIPVTVLFTEPVTGFTIGAIVPGNATAGNFAGGGASYTFDLTPTGQGLVTADVGAGVAFDVALNGNTAAAPFSRTFDTVAPTVSISAPSVSLTAAGPVTFTVTFGGADAVTLAGGDVSLVVTGTASASSITVSGAGTVARTVTVTGIVGDGTLSISVSAGTASDLAGNLAPAAGPSASFNVDNTPPVAPSITSPADGTTTNVATVALSGTAEASSTVTVFDDVTSLGTAAADGSGNWGFNTAALAGGNHPFTATAQDAAGNTGAASSVVNVFIDLTLPVVSSIGSPTPDGTYGIGQTVTITVSFSETVTLAGGDLILTLNTGATVNIAPFGPAASGSGAYVVSAGQSATDLTVTGLALQGGATLRDGVGNDATPGLPGGANLGDNKNIAIAESNPPPAPTGLGQRKSDGVIILAVGGTTDEATVVFRAIVDDPDPAQRLALEVEVQPVGTPFNGTVSGRSPLTGIGGEARVTVTGLANGGHHWQARQVDSLGVIGAWASFGGNADPGDADFVAAVPASNRAPSAPALLGQFRSGGVFPIAVGGTTGESDLVFKGEAMDPDGDAVRLEIERKGVGFPYTSAVSGASAFGAPGSTLSATISGIAAGNHHWQARAVDARGAASGWVSFGGNADVTDADFIVDLSTNVVPSDPSGLSQHDTATSAPELAGFVDDDRTLTFRGIVTDGDPLQTVRLEVEVRAIGAAFTGTATSESAFTAPGTPALVTVSGLATGDYHWQARGVDSAGAASAWVSFGGNAESDADFSVAPAANSAPGDPGALGQFLPDGVTLVGVGFTTVQGTLVFSGTTVDPEGDGWRLQVEVRSTAVALTGTPTGESAPAGSGAAASLTIAGFAPGSYHWQARAVDFSGLASGWVDFGALPGNPDFVVDTAANTAPSAAGLGQFLSSGAAIPGGGGSTSESFVLFRATVGSGDAGQSVRLLVEVKPLGTVFTGAADGTSAWVDSGDTAELLAGGFFTDGTSYHWQAWAEDASGGFSAPVAFGTANPLDPDFMKVANAAPLGLSGADQLLLNGVTSIPVGATTNQSGVIFTATGIDTQGDGLRLQVEIQPLGTAFANAPSATGPVAGTVTIAGLASPAGYHWQARVIDSGGAASAWVSFGANAESDIDFGVDLTSAGVLPGAGGGPLSLYERRSAGYCAASAAPQAGPWAAFAMAGALLAFLPRRRRSVLK